jgi:hypothetical protein
MQRARSNPKDTRTVADVQEGLIAGRPGTLSFG